MLETDESSQSYVLMGLCLLKFFNGALFAISVVFNGTLSARSV